MKTTFRILLGALVGLVLMSVLFTNCNTTDTNKIIAPKTSATEIYTPLIFPDEVIK